jgi:hypothetical protein
MHVAINGWRVMFGAIESLAHVSDHDGHFMVLRTVSGVEHKKQVGSKQQADALIEAILTQMALASSIE